MVSGVDVMSLMIEERVIRDVSIMHADKNPQQQCAALGDG